MYSRAALGAALVGASLAFSWTASAQGIGSVSTNFRWFGPNDKVVIDGFDDPKVQGVSCWVSRARKGGVKGALGLAEDPSDASIACRQTGPITIKDKLKEGEVVFDERRSVLFKTLQVVRFLDDKRNTLVYLVYSDRWISGSPKNSLSTVPIQPWNGPVASLEQGGGR